MLSCQAEWQRSEVGLIGCRSVKARMRTPAIVQGDLRTPTGPFYESCFILGIRGLGSWWPFMRRSIR